MMDLSSQKSFNLPSKNKFAYLDFDTNKNIEVGSLGIVEKDTDGIRFVEQWYHCRERFSENFKPKIKEFAFCMTRGKNQYVMNFMTKIEDILKIPKTKYIATQRCNVMCVEVSSWWKKYAMRRSLLTILMRTANDHYEGNNFEQALFMHKYTSNTKSAIQRFLAGYTRYTGKKVGWYSQFFLGAGTVYRPIPPLESELIKLLVKP